MGVVVDMKKIVVFEHGVETLSFFSMQIAKYLTQAGYAIFVYDLELEQPEEQMRKLRKFCKAGETVVITFNFNGLRGEDEFYNQGELFWKQLRIPCINIMVDHPFYYPALLDKVEEELGRELYYQVAIDRDHEKFMKRFYPQWKEHVIFLPLAGTRVEEIPKQKEYDVVFVGNYTLPSHFRKYIERIDDEYTAFYDGIIADLIEHPDMTMETAFEKHLKREMGEISDRDLRTCMGNMIFLDLYVRFYFRGDVVKRLAEAGIPVHIWGAGFEQVECEKPENIIIEGPTDSEGCLKALSKAKIALNIMPWFKDGSHDRVYSAMLNGAVCVTDESVYLKEECRDGENIMFYSLQDYSDLPDRIRDLLEQDQQREKIVQCAYEKVGKKHTWKQRTEVLIDWIENIWVSA